MDMIRDYDKSSCKTSDVVTGIIVSYDHCMLRYE